MALSSSSSSGSFFDPDASRYTSLPMLQTSASAFSFFVSYATLKRPRITPFATKRAPPRSPLQADLKRSSKEELYGNTWECPSYRLADAVSPKTLKESAIKRCLAEGSYDSLTHEDYNYAIRDPEVEKAFLTVFKARLVKHFKSVKWPSPMAGERSYYPSVIEILNTVRRTVDEVYDKVQHANSGLKPLDERWWARSEFRSYDKEMQDSVDGAPRLKPDFLLVEKGEREEEYTYYWSVDATADSAGSREARFSGEAKGGIADLLAQAATYARAQFSARPLRSYAVVVAFETKKREFRLLVFHHGGVTSSPPLDVNDLDDRMGLTRLFLAIGLWQNPADAGLPFTNERVFHLPSSDLPGAPYLTATCSEILHYSLSVVGKNTHVLGLRLTRSEDSQSAEPVTTATPTVRRSTRRKVNKESRQTRLPNAAARTQKLPSPSYVKPTIMYGPKPGSRAVSALMDLIDGKIDYIDAVGKFSWQSVVNGPIEPVLYANISGEFGVPCHIYSYQACDVDGAPTTNILFLPGKNEKDKEQSFMIVPWDPWRVLGLKGKTIEPDARFLWFTLVKDEGKSLEQCQNPQELCEAVVHALLGMPLYVSLPDDGFADSRVRSSGWLVIYQAGYLHRDVGIRNILYFPIPIDTKAFSVSKFFDLLAKREDLQEYETSLKSLSSSSLPLLELAEESRALSDKVRGGDERMAVHADLLSGIARTCKVVADLEVDVKSRAAMSDGDMAAFWPTYLDKDHREVISGTAEFMASGMRCAIDKREPYIHSPTDDLLSFMWCLVWATLYNDANPASSAFSEEDYWRESIRGAYEQRDRVLAQMKHSIEVNCVAANNARDLSPRVLLLAPIILSLWEKLDRRRANWEGAGHRIRVTPSCPSPDEFLMNSHVHAFHGVADFLETVRDHLEQLRGSQSPMQVD
ncbi:hypothetical protein AAF712_012885 [Marasmius tenuissimus]|uniref:Fungal-type protein kinase domain-containing protein n=1 Tax=Marasmius tenuissimus TaxID=585030 RepID=A0ABR2ZGL0_9AGAR